jgi:glycerol kinase
MRIAAIDQGTTSTRILLVEEDREPTIAHALRHRQIFPRAGLVEHDPEELLANIRACLDAAGPVDAIGIDNQGESCLAWDRRSGRALSPVIVWQDNRTQGAIDRLKADGVEHETLRRAGLPLDPYFSASKLASILEISDEARAALRRGDLRLGTTDAFFLDRLAGRFVTDATTASRTSLMNLETGDWDPELCRLFGVPIEALPPIGPSAGAVLGTIGDVPVTASLVDQQAALYGHGCRSAGDAKITFGTGAFALVLTGSRPVRAAEIGLLPTVAWRIGETLSYAVDGGVYDAGAALEWLVRIGLVASTDDLPDFPSTSAIERGLVFVPALSGLACPHWDRSAAGLWLGMSGATTREDLCQAVLEGIALRTSEVIRAMSERVPLSPSLSIDGGLTRNPYFVQTLADAIGRPLEVATFDELTAFGTAALASLAVGAATIPLPHRAAAVEPRHHAAARWHQRFADAVSRSRAWRQGEGD